MLQETPDIVSLGHLSSREVLNLSGYAGNRSSFYDKTIVDFGCGFSDLLVEILNTSKPKNLVGVDIIFENDKSLQDAKRKTGKYLRELHIAWRDIPETSMKIEERMKTLGEFSKDERIQYTSDIGSLSYKSVDILFINFLLYKIERKENFINMLQPYLSDTGKIIVTDYYSRDENIQFHHRKLGKQGSVSALEIIKMREGIK